MKKCNAGLLILLLTLTFFASCDSGKDGSGGKSLRVRVLSMEGVVAPVSDATLVLGNSDGSMITYGTTDTNGEYTFADPPANATVTAAFSCLQSGATYTTYSLNAVYDVNVPAISIWMDACRKPAALGMITIKTSNSITAATNWDIHIGDESQSVYSLQSQHTSTVYPSMLQSDGKLSIAVIGNDSSGHPVGYGVLLDQSFTDGMTVDINVDKMISYVQYNLSNIPAAVFGVAQLDMDRKGNSISLDDSNWQLSSAVTATTMNIAYIPGFGDLFGYSAAVYLNQNNYGFFTDSSLHLGKFANTGDTPTNQNFDFNQALTIPANLALSYTTGTVRPTFSWTGTDSSADYINLCGRFDELSGNCTLLMMAGPERTSVVFPELPSSLAEYIPANIWGYWYFNLDVSQCFGYDDYLTKTSAQWAAASSFIPSDGYTFRMSAVVYSTTPLAPKLNKSRASMSPMGRIKYRL